MEVGKNKDMIYSSIMVFCCSKLRTRKEFYDMHTKTQMILEIVLLVLSILPIFGLGQEGRQRHTGGQSPAPMPSYPVGQLIAILLSLTPLAFSVYYCCKLRSNITNFIKGEKNIDLKLAQCSCAFSACQMIFYSVVMSLYFIGLVIILISVFRALKGFFLLLFLVIMTFGFALVIPVGLLTIGQMVNIYKFKADVLNNLTVVENNDLSVKL